MNIVLEYLVEVDKTDVIGIVSQMFDSDLISPKNILLGYNEFVNPISIKFDLEYIVSNFSRKEMLGITHVNCVEGNRIKPKKRFHLWWNFIDETNYGFCKIKFIFNSSYNEYKINNKLLNIFTLKGRLIYGYIYNTALVKTNPEAININFSNEFINLIAAPNMYFEEQNNFIKTDVLDDSFITETIIINDKKIINVQLGDEQKYNSHLAKRYWDKFDISYTKNKIHKEETFNKLKDLERRSNLYSIINQSKN